MKFRAAIFALYGVFAVEAVAFVALGRPIVDEGVYLNAGRLLYAGELPYRDFPFSQGPTLPMVYGAATALFGPSIWVGRCVSLLLCLVSVVCAATIARRFGRDRFGASIAECIAITVSILNLPAVWISTTVRTQSLATPLAMLSVLALCRKPKSAWGWAIAPSLMLWSSGVRLTNALAFALVAFWIAASLRRSRPTLLRVGAIVAAQVPIVFAPVLLAPRAALEHVLLAQLGRGDRLGWPATSLSDAALSHLAHFFGPQGDFFPIVVVSAVVMIAIGAGPRSGWRTVWELPIRDPIMAQLALLSVAAALYVAQIPLKSAHVTYFVPASMLCGPAIGIALGNWLSEARPRAGRSAPAALLASFLLLSVVSAASDWRTWIGTEAASFSRFRQEAAELGRLAGEDCTIASFETNLAYVAGCRPMRGLEYSIFSFYREMPTERAEALGFLNLELFVQGVKQRRPDLVVLRSAHLRILRDDLNQFVRPKRPIDPKLDLRRVLEDFYVRQDAIRIASGPHRDGQPNTIQFEVYRRADLDERLWSHVTPPSESAATPERIVLIVVDMLRRDHIGAYGAARPTPHIDALAARGQAFASAVSSYSSTTMSMSALFTGRTPSIETGSPQQALHWNGSNWCGLARLAEEDDLRCIPATAPTLAAYLRTAGYTTLGVTSNKLLYEPAGFAQGFDVWIEAGAGADESDDQPQHLSGAYGGTLAGSVNAAVRDALKQRRGDRFFLYVHYMDAHDFEEIGVDYAEGVALADAGVGELIAQLDADGLLQNSQVIFTSDHGERLGELHPIAGREQHFGNPSFEYLLEVPLIVSPAPDWEIDADAPIRGDDLMRRLSADATGSGPPPSDLEPGEQFISEWHWQTYSKHGWKAMFSRSRDQKLLFDLGADPHETRDVSDQYPARLAEMEGRVDALTAALAAPNRLSRGLTELERQRLRALGYLETVESISQPTDPN